MSDFPDGYWDLRTAPVVVDGVMWPVTACAECGKRFPPYMAPVPAVSHDEYCWGHDVEKDDLLALARDLLRFDAVDWRRGGVCVLCDTVIERETQPFVGHADSCLWVRALAVVARTEGVQAASDG